MHRSIGLLLGLHALALFAQEGPKNGDFRDGAFLEGGGHGVYWSVNYERTRYWSSKWATHGRVGLGLFPRDNILLITLPLTFSASYGGTSRGEAGLGVTPYVQIARGPYGSSVGDVLIPVVHAGYRYQEPDGTWFVRAGALLAPARNSIRADGKEVDALWNPYLGLGLLF